MRLRAFVLAFALANLAYGGLQHAMTAQSEPRPSMLSGEDVMRILPGNTLLSYDESGPFWLYYPGPSTVWGQSSTGDVDVGRWWVEDGRYCRAWRSWHDGRTQCWIVASYGDDRIIWMDGTEIRGESLVQPGNSIGSAPPRLLASSATDVVVEAAVVAPAIGPGQPSASAEHGRAHNGTPSSSGRGSEGGSSSGPSSSGGSSGGDSSGGSSSGGGGSTSSGGGSSGGGSSGGGGGSSGGSSGSDSSSGGSSGGGNSAGAGDGGSNGGKGKGGGKGGSKDKGDKGDRAD